MSAHEVGIDLDRSAIAIGGCLEPPKLQKQLGKIDLQIGGTGIEPGCLTERCFGLLKPPHPAQDVPEIGMHLGTARIEADGALTARDRGHKMPLLAQCEPQIAMSGGEIGSQGDGSAITGASIREPFCRAQGIAEIGMALREVGYGGDCLADQFNRLIRIAPRRSDYTEQMEGIRISRRLPQKLPVERLGAIELSGPMMFEGGGQIGGRRRVARPIGAITVARHLASIPPRVSGGLQPSLPQSVSTHLPRSMRRALIANREMTG
jgi:hypothetical protein